MWEGYIGAPGDLKILHPTPLTPAGNLRRVDSWPGASRGNFY